MCLEWVKKAATDYSTFSQSFPRYPQVISMKWPRSKYYRSSWCFLTRIRPSSQNIQWTMCWGRASSFTNRNRWREVGRVRQARLVWAQVKLQGIHRWLRARSKPASYRSCRSCSTSSNSKSKRSSETKYTHMQETRQNSIKLYQL